MANASFLLCAKRFSYSVRDLLNTLPASSYQFLVAVAEARMMKQQLKG